MENSAQKEETTVIYLESTLNMLIQACGLEYVKELVESGEIIVNDELNVKYLRISE